jgi:ELWxxDGT repeat protein
LGCADKTEAALFEGADNTGQYGLWVTNGTAAGTFEFTGITGAYFFAIVILRSGVSNAPGRRIVSEKRSLV